MVALLFEASTPFLHLRMALIQSRNAGGPLFKFVQVRDGGLCLFACARLHHSGCDYRWGLP
jgi:hypothetical protein